MSVGKGNGKQFLFHGYYSYFSALKGQRVGKKVSQEGC